MMNDNRNKNGSNYPKGGGNYNNRPYTQQQPISLPNIELDYIKDPELFNETAKKTASAISGTKSTQIRNFYDYIMDLEEKAQNGELFSEILPFVRMLNSKANYARERRVASAEFTQMLSKCVSQISTPKQLTTFKLFFEAVIGFSKKNK
ncbi:MAG: type III-A CRISPR-associated protein Csm2 [Campylobacterales bacterium]|nr:type III-A CRISPR-associated protein Csm2 [Campylobacterales bacterium]